MREFRIVLVIALTTRLTTLLVSRSRTIVDLGRECCEGKGLLFLQSRELNLIDIILLLSHLILVLILLLIHLIHLPNLIPFSIAIRRTVKNTS
jgi:hypothetical protein